MMTLVWLRVALVFYAAGLLYALVALARTSSHHHGRKVAQRDRVTPA